MQRCLGLRKSISPIHMLQLATTAVVSWALGGGPKMPLGGTAPMRQVTTFCPAPAAAALITVSFPSTVLADDGGGIVDTLVNGVLTLVVLGFVAFIGSVSGRLPTHTSQLLQLLSTKALNLTIAVSVRGIWYCG